MRPCWCQAPSEVLETQRHWLRLGASPRLCVDVRVMMCFPPSHMLTMQDAFLSEAGENSSGVFSNVHSHRRYRDLCKILEHSAGWLDLKHGNMHTCTQMHLDSWLHQSSVDFCVLICNYILTSAMILCKKWMVFPSLFAENCQMSPLKFPW